MIPARVRHLVFFFTGLFLCLLASRLCHLHILWAEEGYGAAGAVQLLHDKAIYRDFWFDKPPLAAVIYTLWGGEPGWGLRLGGAIFALLCCVAAYHCAKSLSELRHSHSLTVAVPPEQLSQQNRARQQADLSSEHEGFWAAGLLGFFLVFDLPPSVMTLGPDLLTVLPHLAAVYFAIRNRCLWSGICCGIALACNAKALLLLPICIAWNPAGWWKILLGWAAASGAWLGWIAELGSFRSFWQQVWEFGQIYARDTFVHNPWREGILRTFNWMGFHIALMVAAVWAYWKHRLFRQKKNLSAALDHLYEPLPPKLSHERERVVPLDFRRSGFIEGRWFPWFIWFLCGLIGVVAGLRFFPRYYFLLLVPFVILAARGFVSSGRWRIAFLLLLLLPAIRFGPRYFVLARDLMTGREHQWADLALNQDSQFVSQKIRERMVLEKTNPNGGLLIWGYRPDLFAYTQLPAASRFLDSQPLTGVLADRHLSDTHVSIPELAEQGRKELLRTQPKVIVDGLGPLNPRLAITQYEDLQPWLANYQEAFRTKFSVVYFRHPGR